MNSGPILLSRTVEVEVLNHADDALRGPVKLKILVSSGSVHPEHAARQPR